MPFILVSLICGVSLVAMPWLLVICLRRLLMRRLEEQILWEKYGDLPMFKAFFAREMRKQRNGNDATCRHRLP